MVSIESMTIKLEDGTEIKLSLKEAEGLFNQLKLLFGRRDTEYVPYPVIPARPSYPTYPWYDPVVITCTNGAKITTDEWRVKHQIESKPVICHDGICHT
jgi:hypothetical protein